MFKLYRDYKRIKQDDAFDALLNSSTGQHKIAQLLDAEIKKSSLVALLEQTLEIKGNIIECGVFRGRSIRWIGHALKTNAVRKTIYACDSYEGFPENGITPEDTSWNRFSFRLKRKFGNAGDVPARLEHFFKALEVDGRVVKGFFENTLSSIPDTVFSFIHLDSDTYSSHVYCLNALYDKLAPGGIIVFDDYAQAKWPGATKAVDEFFADKAEKPQLCTERETPAWFVKKLS